MLLVAFIMQYVSSVHSTRLIKRSDMRRYSLILSLLRAKLNIKLCDSWRVRNVQIDCKTLKWKIVHGISSRTAGKVILLNDR